MKFSEAPRFVEALRFINAPRMLAGPIFVAPEIEPLPRVMPLAIFAAGRTQFEFVVRGFANSIEAKILVFRHVPLEEYGWTREDAKVRHIRNEKQGMVFRIERS